MPQLACETDLDDLSGMLSLNNDAEEQIYAHIRAGFNALIQRSHDVDVADGSDGFTESPELLNSLLENLIKVPSNPENLNVLTKCLSLIGVVCGRVQGTTLRIFDNLSYR
jgi:hypothetical protein